MKKYETKTTKRKPFGFAFSGVISGLAFIVVMISTAIIANGQGGGDTKEKTGTVRKNSIGMELVYISPGQSFVMGSAASETNRDADEGPTRKVTVARGFWIGKYEVTQQEYKKVMDATPSGFRDCPRCPVETVSLEDAKEFANRLNSRNDGFKYRLPTEAEWELAARAGTKTATAFGDSLSAADANFDTRHTYNGGSGGEYLVRTAEVGNYKPNAWGIYDMHGNVWEWVEDFYVKQGYEGIPADGTANVSKGDQYKRVRRGGGWDSWGKALRSANRTWKNPRDSMNNGGFRIVAEKK
jgi:formylglycine-generating enzyme required for sulfatase activity